MLRNLGLNAQGLQTEDGVGEATPDPQFRGVVTLLTELLTSQAHEVRRAILDIVVGTEGDVDQLVDVLAVLPELVTRELPVTENQVDVLVDVVTNRPLAKLGELDPAVLATTTLARLHAESSVWGERLSGVVQPRGANTLA